MSFSKQKQHQEYLDNTNRRDSLIQSDDVKIRFYSSNEMRVYDDKDERQGGALLSALCQVIIEQQDELIAKAKARVESNLSKLKEEAVNEALSFAMWKDLEIKENL